MLAEDAGLPMRMPLVVANSHLALEAAEYVRATSPGGTSGPSTARCFRRTSRRRGILEMRRSCATLRAPSAPMTRACARRWPTETYAAHIDEVTNAARADEILSTPTFIYEGGFRLTGAQDYAVFRSITQRLLARRHAVD